MTRQEAINEIMSTWSQRDSDFCATQEEYELSRKEMHEALNALGVTDEEIDS